MASNKREQHRQAKMAGYQPEAPSLSARIRTCEERLGAGLDRAWQSGWQPSEVLRSIERQLGKLAATLIEYAIAADRAQRDDGSLHPAWSAHLDALNLPRVAGTFGWLGPWLEQHRLPLDQDTFLEVVPALVELLRPMPRIIPPPGCPEATTIDLTSRFDDPMLQRIRALLAQAESTTFDAEAETFTAKAQSLMTRHAITEAMLDARHQTIGKPVTIRIPVDDPYVSQKMALASSIARNTRCQCVMMTGLAMVSIIGMPNDVATTDMLYTSLLVQATTALQQRVSNAAPGSPERSRGFRASFWYGYGRRIDERLAAINEYVTAEAVEEYGDSMVPVLASRDARVKSAVDEWFPNLASRRIATGSDPAGWATGRVIADNAKLNTGQMKSQKAALPAPAPH